MKYDRIYNFSAGPAMMPESVLEEIRDEMMNYRGSGMCVMEMSHRSKVFEEILHEAEADLRDLMGIPDNYKVLFVQGGGTLQFAGNGSGGERRYMLTFRALSEGDCQVSVTEASVITSPQDAGEGAEADGSAGNAAEAVPVVADITSLGSAAVRIQPPVDCTLSSLSIEGVPAFAFEPDIAFRHKAAVSQQTHGSFQQRTLSAA